MRSAFRSGLSLALACCFVACDDDAQQGGGSTYYPGDQSRPVSAMTQAEWEQGVSRSMADMAAALSIENTCLGVAVMATATVGGDSAACEASYQGCMQYPPDQGNVEPDPTTAWEEFQTAAANCEVTVGELDTCAANSIGRMEDYYASLSCDDPTMPDLQSLRQTSAECSDFLERCPGIFGLDGFDF